jgi:phosphatidylinositol kinase/protein kinase (PI-3  family)
MKQELIQQSKKDLIQEVLALELEMPVLDSKENILKELSEWFDTDINELRKEDFYKLFNQYIDDLYSYLLDYSEEELRERIRGLKEYQEGLK